MKTKHLRYMTGERVLVRSLGLGRVRMPSRCGRVAITLDTGLDYIAIADAVERVPSP